MRGRRRWRTDPDVAESVARLVLAVSPLVYLWLISRLSLPWATALLAAEAVLMFRLFDLDLRLFPLVLRLFDQVVPYNALRDFPGYFFHRHYCTSALYGVFVAAGLIALRTAAPESFHALFLHDGFGLDVIVWVLTAVEGTLFAVDLPQRPVEYAEELRLLSASWEYYRVTRGSYHLAEWAVIGFNAALAMVANELLLLAMAARSLPRMPWDFFVYRWLYIRAFGAPLFVLALAVMSALLFERDPPDDPYPDGTFSWLYLAAVYFCVNGIVWCVEHAVVAVAILVERRLAPYPGPRL